MAGIIYETGSLFPMIKSLKNTFTKSENKVVEAFLKNPDEVLYCSITDFAEKSGVGDTTVIRFCRKLGFKGYQDFKMSLAQELSSSQLEPHTTLNEEISVKDDLDTVMQKMVNINVAALQETIALLRKDQIEKAVSFIENSHQTVFYGVGASGLSALEAKNKFMRIGVPVDAYTDGHMQAMSASLLKEADTAVAISYSGSTKDTISSIKIAKENHVKTVCITHYARSPVTQYADVVLISGYKEGPFQGGALTTKIAQLFVIDVLYTEYFRRNMKKSSVNKSKSVGAISDKLY